MGSTLLNIVLFIVIAAAIALLFFYFLRYLGRASTKKEKELFQELARRSGYAYYEQDTLGLQRKIEGLFDFGISKLCRVQRMGVGFTFLRATMSQ